MVDVRVTELSEPRMGAPGSLVLVHQEQALVDARVHAGGDDGLGLQVLIIVVGSATASVLQGRGWQVLHGVAQRSSRSARASSSSAIKSCAAFVGRVGTRRAQASSVRALYSAMIGWLGVPKMALKCSTMVETKERQMMRLATKAERATPSTGRRPRPPQVTPVVATKSGLASHR